MVTEMMYSCTTGHVGTRKCEGLQSYNFKIPENQIITHVAGVSPIKVVLNVGREEVVMAYEAIPWLSIGKSPSNGPVRYSCYP